jgi:citrate synthase
MLRSGVSLLAHFDDEPDDKSEAALLKKAVSLTARMPMIVAVFDRLRKGMKPVPHQAGLGTAERFLYQLKGERPSPDACRAMDMALVLHAEHGFNASTFAARVAASTRSDMYSAITSAVGTLKGALHGGANQRVIAMLEDIGELDKVEGWIRDRLAKKERIFGFGHRIYKTSDPRALFLRDMSRELGRVYGQTKWYELSVRIEEVVKAEKGIDANVDFYSAGVYHTIGIPSDLFTPIFAIARIAGWTAHVMEQVKNNRLIRPLARYIGPTNQKFIPIDER